MSAGGERMSVDREPGTAAGYETSGNAEKGSDPVRPKSTSLPVRLALIAGSVIFSLIVLELGCRVLRSGLEGLTHWPNLASSLLSIGEDGYGPCTYAHDATLGWILPITC